MEPQLNYGNWIRKKVLIILGLCALVAGALVFLPLGFYYQLAVLVLFVVLLVSFLFPLYASIMFSQRGGGFQDRLYNLIIRSLGADADVNAGGTILDIGTGNGVLAVKLAREHKNIRVVGLDYWGKNWEYSRNICEKNALAAGVGDRVRYQKGDAAALEFDDAAFDGAVSNLTFHEVRSARDKREVLKEALRVVKPGGGFAFIDYFYDTGYYGKSPEFEEFLKSLKLSRFECTPLRRRIRMPLPLRHPRILGKAGLLTGRK